jgi:hypothetical protein
MPEDCRAGGHESRVAGFEAAWHHGSGESGCEDPSLTRLCLATVGYAVLGSVAALIRSRLAAA